VVSLPPIPPWCRVSCQLAAFGHGRLGRIGWAAFRYEIA
jgi:hypothetical protein